MQTQPATTLLDLIFVDAIPDIAEMVLTAQVCSILSNIVWLEYFKTKQDKTNHIV